MTVERRKDRTIRTGLSVESIKRAFHDNLFYLLGRFPEVATTQDNYQALAYTVRDRLLKRWLDSAQRYKNTGARTVCYMSAEFLLGPHLANNLLNLEIADNSRQALTELGLDFDEILAEEVEPGLGNGGLGRLAACYMDSMATLCIPAIGYGIRYEYGIFNQEIRDGWQVEVSDLWLRNGNPWEIARSKLRFGVGFGGRTERYHDVQGIGRTRWLPEYVVNGMAYDTPILGHGVDNASLLRLWEAEATSSFDFQAFNVGNYYGAVNAKIEAENITKVLYPNDEPEVGKSLRLKQQFFFVSCSLQDMIRLYKQREDNLEGFHHKFVTQLNDTHPAIAVAELMRLLVDEHLMDWKQAWHITRNCFAYTNHTLLPEALETWSVELFQKLLPRHLEIIYEINQEFLDDVRLRHPWDSDLAARVSLIGEEGGKRVRMANLACVGSFAINGVARLHSDLLKQTVLKDFYQLWPEKFSNKTNGVSPRRFLQLSNPGLCGLLTETLGGGSVANMERLRGIEPLADDAAFQQRWAEVKRQAKARLARQIKAQTDIDVNLDSMFDIQVKRIHEYKRQHLKVLHIISLYNQLKANPQMSMVPRTFIFSGKAAPGYAMAKLIIKLITSVASVIDRDPRSRDLLRLVFLPNFNVKNGQVIYPGADLSEQISLAGMEASGTGNMKFAMNGALTMGTLDGANVEIREEVGEENFYLFGMTTEEVVARRQQGYRPRDHYEQDGRLREVLDLISAGVFSRGDTGIFEPLVRQLLDHDPYMVLADYGTYLDAQARADQDWQNHSQWTRMSILNTARVGKFSSDRSIRDYAADIWKIEPQMTT